MKTGNEKGIILITSYMVIAALSILTVASVRMAVTEYNFATRHYMSIKSFYAAEAALDLLTIDLSNKIADPETGLESAYDGSDLDSATIDFLSTGFNVSVKCTPIDSEHNGDIPNSKERHWKLTATAVEPQTGVSRTVNQVVIVRKYYVYGCGAFFYGDLEMHPEDTMTLEGMIRANGDIYITSPKDIVVNSDYLWAAGRIYNSRKTDGSTDEGSVSIKAYDSSNYYKMLEPSDTTALDSSRSDWYDSSQSRWRGTVKSDIHGINTIAAPSIDIIQPTGFYASKAGLKILNGTLYEGTKALVEGVDIPEGTLSTSTGFFNQRENSYIKMSDLDLKKLAGWEAQVDSNGDPVLDSNGDPVYVKNYQNKLPSNGIIYATRDDAYSFEQPGIRLLNGSNIEATDGLTVVSDLPLYIQGDFNSDNKKPVSVIADAINVVSELWDDSDSTLALGHRRAKHTTINAAFIAGVDETVGTEYGGGLENFLRFHENWSGVELVLYTSLISPWQSQVAKGPFSDSSFYHPPPQRWNFDQDFLDTSKLPPFTPYLVEVERVAYWRGSSGDPSEYENAPSIE